MNYNGTIYRPPLEADTFLLPVTEGCTHNSCAFCNMYQGVSFRMLPLADIEEFLKEVVQAYGTYCNTIERVYLVGADPFALSAQRLLERIDLVKSYLPMRAPSPCTRGRTTSQARAMRTSGTCARLASTTCTWASNAA